MSLTQRREDSKTLIQILLDEPLPQSNSMEDMTDYTRRLMTRLTSKNLLKEIEAEKTLANAVVRAQIISVLPSYFVCKLIDGDEEVVGPTSPTYIRTISDLHNLVRDNPAGHFKLANDINATDATRSGGDYYNEGKGWNPIGDRIGDAETGGFYGFFDGNGKQIIGLKIDRGDEDYVGLFGFLGKGAYIKDLTLKDVNITGADNVGGLAGQSFGTIANCHVTGSSTVNGGSGAENDDIGGLLGDNDGWVDRCSSAGIVHGKYDVGGLVGDNDSIITNSHSSMTVYGSQKGDIGGLVGDNKGFKVDVPLGNVPERGTVYNCYATGDVYSEDSIDGAPGGDIGGLVGDNRGGTISLSYATGDVEGKQPDVGGFVGSNKRGDNEIGGIKDSIITNCYCLGDVTPKGSLPDSGDCGGFVGDNRSGQVFNCYCVNAVYVTGGVNERDEMGDFCGDNPDDGIVSGCYYNTDTALIGSSDGGTGKTTAEMKREETYEDWDFDDIWEVEEDTSYPTLIEVDTTNKGIINVFPVSHTGIRSLSGDVRPKMTAGMMLHAVKTPSGIYYTPTITQDYNFPIGNSDIEDDAISNPQLQTDSVKKTQLAAADDGSILGNGLDWGANDVIEVDLSELESTGLDYTDVVDEITIGFDNPFAYVSTKTYSTNQKVSYSGINYNSLQDTNLNKTPDSEPTWWESIGSQKVIKVEESITGDGLNWSIKKKIQVNQGNGLDINASNQLEVDITEVIAIQEASITADSTKYNDTDWHTVLTKVVTAAAGSDLLVCLFIPCSSDDVGIGDKRGKFNARLKLGLVGGDGSTVIEGRYELPDHGNQVPVSMMVTIENIDPANPYIRLQLKNDDNTINQVRIDCVAYDGQFSVIILKKPV